jgi:hypothetical protein
VEHCLIDTLASHDWDDDENPKPFLRGFSPPHTPPKISSSPSNSPFKVILSIFKNHPPTHFHFITSSGVIRMFRASQGGFIHFTHMHTPPELARGGEGVRMRNRFSATSVPPTSPSMSVIIIQFIIYQFRSSHTAIITSIPTPTRHQRRAEMFLSKIQSRRFIIHELNAHHTHSDAFFSLASFEYIKKFRKKAIHMLLWGREASSARKYYYICFAIKRFSLLAPRLININHSSCLSE